MADETLGCYNIFDLCASIWLVESAKVAVL